jgi:UDP-N-acetylmuramyl pentapeptide phosphotransferase/UDP-N-acetylglucosamine-1-phosphate transferase
MSFLILLFVVAITFALSCWLTYAFSKPDSMFCVLDHPNERSLHARPTPRTGGLAILSSFVVAVALQSWWQPLPNSLFWIVIALAPVAAVSFLDDRKGLPIRYRLIVQLAASAFVVGYALDASALSASIGGALPASLVALLSVFALVWMTNLYNFMDGMDGFAGGMAVAGFGVLALLGWLGGDRHFAMLSLVVVFAAAGFLVFNFPPARVFMGDSGSSTLGLLAGALSLWGIEQHLFSPWVAILVFSPFIADATVTLLRRLFAGEAVWKPHRTHYYQRLVQFGWGHRKTVLVEYALMSGCGITAIAIAQADGATQAAAFCAWAAVYAGLFWWIGWREGKLRRGRSGKNKRRT